MTRLRLHAIGLFEGIGGIGLALERAGIPPVAAVEIDPACRGVLRAHWLDLTLFHDVTEVIGDQLRDAGFDPRHGILTAGWPCQGNSVAGRRQGMDDARSGLWMHVARLLAELRPRWFIGENVPGLLSVNDGRDIAVVRRDLAQLGYWWAERILDAQHFGVPQRRRRLFIVGHLGDRAAPVQVLLEPEGGGRDSAPGPTARSGTANGAPVSALQGGGRRGHQIDVEGAAGGHLLPINALTSHHGRNDPNEGGLVAFALRRDPGGVGQGHNTTYITRAFTSEGADASEDGSGRGTPLVPVSLAVAGDYSSGEDIAQTVRAANGQPGNVAYTLCCVPGGGQENNTNYVPTATAVRRLTPRECERLQGFPDDWTDGQSDSARYRQLGNAVAVPVVEWIARRIVQYERAGVVAP